LNKISFFTEVPTAHLEELDNVIDGHFCISSYCLQDPVYYDYYARHKTNKPVMLDNGMFEDGHPISIEHLLAITKAIKPQVVFAPDQVGDAVLTKEMSVNFFHRCANDVDCKFSSIAFIPQGSDALEVAVSYGQMYQWLRRQGIQYPIIGISFLNDRDEVLQCINELYGGLFDTYHHFLGLYHIDEIKRWPKEIYSMDTIKPFKAAYYGHKIEDCPRGTGKWTTDMELVEEHKALLYRNIAKMHTTLTRG